jgi:hypothetical protein
MAQDGNGSLTKCRCIASDLVLLVWLGGALLGKDRRRPMGSSIVEFAATLAKAIAICNVEPAREEFRLAFLASARKFDPVREFCFLGP